MELELTAAPAAEPVTLTQAKSQCRVTASDDDTFISSLITAARAYVETYTGKALITQTWCYHLDHAWPTSGGVGKEQQCIVLPKPPVSEVVSVKYLNLSDAETTLATDQYRVDLKRYNAIIVPEVDVVWPEVLDTFDAIRVSFKCGFGAADTNVPGDIKQALLMLISHWYNNREAAVVGTISGPMEFAVEALLFPHRVFYSVR